MLRAMTLAVAIVSVAVPTRGHAQDAPEMERLKSAVLREVVPLPFEEARNYVTEEGKKWLPSPGDGAYEELEALRRQYVDSIDQVETNILSATFIGDYVLVLARVVVVYKPNIDLPSPTSANGDLYELVRRGDGEWLSAAAPFPYSPQSFLQMYTRALEKHANVAR